MDVISRADSSHFADSNPTEGSNTAPSVVLRIRHHGVGLAFFDGCDEVRRHLTVSAFSAFAYGLPLRFPARSSVSETDTTRSALSN